MNLVQRIYRYIRYRNFLQLCKGIPVINLILQPQINRYFFARVLFIFFVAFPVVGIFRRAYIKNKFNTYLKSNQKKTQIQLKQSIAEFNIKADAGVEYVIIVTLHQLKEKDENSISDIDNQNSSKIFNMIEEAQENQQAFQMKWAFLGSKKLYEVIENSRNALKPKNKLPVQFHEKESENKQSKVYLVAIQDEGEKVIMQWNAGVPYKEITKYIAKHKFKKYLKLVNF